MVVRGCYRGSVSTERAETRDKLYIPVLYSTSLPLLNPASAAQFHSENFEYAAVDKQSLSIPKNKHNLRNLKTEDLPNQSCNLCIHGERSYSIGGSRNMTWFCIRISWTIGFNVMLPSKNYTSQ